ncbi:hypothetical protein DFH08DRAFT_317807 [Mycena albidolilacea]|uniref:Uncharacterized protein n=1 Tax=Mycena albidolilacea TaxID=1033008 RepID=A0AAD7EKD8_9AGAR|nr:hypothetical protein DFH08DRAFT_317807 [Mycena albidolilacea]
MSVYCYFCERLSNTCTANSTAFGRLGNVREGSTAPPTSQLPPPPALSLSLSAMLFRMRRISSARITSDALAATRLTLNAIQASTDAFPPLKSSVSVVLVIMELSQRAKSNKKACEHITKRSAQLVQDIWRQTKDFGVVLPEEVERSVVDIENLFKEIESFFGGLETEKAWERFVRQDLHKSQVAEYGRLLDEAMMQFSINLELSIHRLHMAFVAADEKRHAAVLTVSQMSESERLQLLTQIRGDVRDLGDVHMGKYVLASFIFLDHDAPHIPWPRFILTSLDRYIVYRLESECGVTYAFLAVKHQENRPTLDSV